MNAQCSGPKYSKLTLIVIVTMFFAGCSNLPFSNSTQPSRLSEIEGKWFWSQNGPWHGYFVLKKDGNTYTGTLDDTFEGTNGDRIENVAVSNDHIKFTRNGAYGIQYWEGDLKVEDGQIKIIDGQWKKQGEADSDSFVAEKIH